MQTGSFLFPVAMTDTLTKATLGRKGFHPTTISALSPGHSHLQQEATAAGLQGAHRIPREGREARVRAGFPGLSSVLHPDLGNGVTVEVTHLDGL